MQHHSKPSPDVPKWSALLAEAVRPGLIMEAYSASITTGSAIKSLPSCNANADLNPARSSPFPDGRH
jgi:hypothetical protein